MPVRYTKAAAGWALGFIITDTLAENVFARRIIEYGQPAVIKRHPIFLPKSTAKYMLKNDHSIPLTAL